jgi:phosphate transport system permease protein
MISSAVTSLTVVLIVVFLFKEGLSMFNKKAVEDGYVIAVNKSNRVKNRFRLGYSDFREWLVREWIWQFECRFV